LKTDQPIFVVGTRPELIKVAPVFKCFQAADLDPQLILTNQQGSMVLDLLPWFEIYNPLALPELTEQSLIGKFWEISKNLSSLITTGTKKKWVFAQGDTTTVAATAITSFYTENYFAHLEAGLRCDTPWLPFPEEGNRRIASQISKLNFAPTMSAVDNLIKSGVDAATVHLVGNTGIDALLASAKKSESLTESDLFSQETGRTKILVTMHRRESFGAPMIEACRAIAYIAETFQVEILWPVHSNPRVREIITTELSGIDSIRLVEPLNYPELVSVMKGCDFILTDSGGIQEEAPALGKPVLVLREETERQELIEEGGGILVGTDYSKIVNFSKKLIQDRAFYNSMQLNSSPFGDGNSAKAILEIYKSHVD
jgi:UDP-N-acetylglucosamine 2-epimerase (non-hydrolysing)